MITVAITGGIGAGKTTLTDHLIRKGYTVIDADKMAREMTGPGGKAMPYILENFGPQFINEDGSLDRKAMRDLVFRYPEYKKTLEAGTTEVVISDIRKIREEREAAGDHILFFDIPLLFENHLENDYDQIWVVTADHEIRAERIMKRDNISPEIIGLIMDSQEDEAVKISRADVVLVNNGTEEEFISEIDRLLEMF